MRPSHAILVLAILVSGCAADTDAAPTPSVVEPSADSTSFAASPSASPSAVASASAEPDWLALPSLAGAVTATEVQAALAEGLTAVKFFPASTSGGAPAIKALSAPFAGLRFVPTGGVGPAVLSSYLSLPAVLAVGGSWLAPGDVVAAGLWDQVTHRTRAALHQIHDEETR